jgi:hypothetical protein
MMTFRRRARTKILLMTGLAREGTDERELGDNSGTVEWRFETNYALGKLRPRLAMTSAMQMVAERLTPTRQWTSVAVLSFLPRPLSTISMFSFTL